MEEGDGEIADHDAPMIKMPEPSKNKAELFAVFSRFEFALKKSGFVMGDCSRKASPDWDAFADTLSFDRFEAAVFSDPDVVELMTHPPKKQIVICHPDASKSCDWIDAVERPDRSVKSMLRAVRRVRNNLFHGEKHGEDPRDEQLCKASKRILLACVTMNDDISHYFQGLY